MSLATLAAADAAERLVLRSAFCLHLFGDEAALRHQAPFDKSLRAVLERVGKGIAANVADGQVLALFLEHEIDAPIAM